MIHRNFLQMFLLFSAGYLLCYLLLRFGGCKESHLKTVKQNFQLTADDSVKPPVANLSLIQGFYFELILTLSKIFSEFSLIRGNVYRRCTF